MLDLQHLEKQISSRDLFEAFKNQLAKDFEQSNFQTDFIYSLEPDFDKLCQTIASELQRSESRADAKLPALLYRVDISETQLMKQLTDNTDKNYYANVAELIIKRVLQKVVIKQYYKNR